MVQSDWAGGCGRVAHRRDNQVRQLVAFFTFPLRDNYRSRFDLCTQFIHRKGLFDVAGNSQFLGLRYGSVIGSRGEHDERNIRVGGADLPEFRLVADPDRSHAAITGKVIYLKLVQSGKVAISSTGGKRSPSTRD